MVAACGHVRLWPVSHGRGLDDPAGVITLVRLGSALGFLSRPLSGPSALLASLLAFLRVWLLVTTLLLRSSATFNKGKTCMVFYIVMRDLFYSISLCKAEIDRHLTNLANPF